MADTPSHQPNAAKEAATGANRYQSASSSENARSNRRIYGLLLFVVFLWGINVIMVKYLTSYFPPLALAPIRIFLATLLLVPAVIHKDGYEKPPRSAWLPITGVALFAIVLHQLTLSWGVAATSGNHAVLILSLNPLLTAILASRLVAEPLTWPKGLGVILGFSGVMLVVSGKTQGVSTLSGDLVLFLATITVVIGYLFVKKCAEQVTPLVVTAYSHALATVILVIFGLAANPVWYYEGAFALWPMVILVFSSLVCTALGAVWWNTGIHRIGASKASLFQNGIPVTGVFASAVFLGEQLQWLHLAALGLVIVGVSLGTGVISWPPQRLPRLPLRTK
jgi:drug/metabolite transporter (DMT)-like permease